MSSLETGPGRRERWLAPAIVLFMLGFALVTIVAGLALAALAARQVRSAEALIRHEPVLTLRRSVLAGLVVIPVVAILAMITVVGAPLGLAILFVVWPAAAYRRLPRGRHLDRRMAPRTDEHARATATRPYLAAVVGLIVLPDHQHRAVRRRDRQPVRVRGRPASRLADVPPAVSRLGR